MAYDDQEPDFTPGEPFDPRRFVSDIPKVGKYMEVKWRVVWLNETEPRFRLRSTFALLNEQQAVVLATVDILDTDGTIVKSADGMAVEFRASFLDYVEKAQTSAIGRALALVGFGHQFAVDLSTVQGGKIADGGNQTYRQQAGAGAGAGRPAGGATAATTGQATGGGPDITLDEFWNGMKNLGRKKEQIMGRLGVKNVPAAEFGPKHLQAWKAANPSVSFRAILAKERQMVNAETEAAVQRANQRGASDSPYTGNEPFK